MGVRTKYHSLIYVPVADKRKSNLPIILMPDGSRFFEALHWTAERFKHGLSGATLKKQVEAVGTFIDFFYGYKGEPEVTPEILRSLLEEFTSLRAKGCEALGWSPITPNVARRELEYISMFFDHCADAFGYLPVNASVEVSTASLSYKDRLRESKRADLRRKGLLGYLWKTSRSASGRTWMRAVCVPRSSPVDGNSFKSFPPLMVAPVLESCHSIRDVLALILLFYGGVRSSELCHILLQDVSPFPDPKTGEALVTLAHPEFGLVDYHRKSDGKLRRGIQRQVYLAEEYELAPRNTLSTSDPLHAGWKGMTYEDKGYHAKVYWSRPDMGILFYSLHRRYMDIRARAAGRHAYYFVSSDAQHSGANYGQPMKLKSLRDRFHDACVRVGLTPGRANGVNPHAARHFYGYFLANILRVSKEMAQRFLHHASIESTDVYYALSAATARDDLMKAFENAASSSAHPLVQPINLKVR